MNRATNLTNFYIAVAYAFNWDDLPESAFPSHHHHSMPPPKSVTSLADLDEFVLLFSSFPPPPTRPIFFHGQIYVLFIVVCEKRSRWPFCVEWRPYSPMVCNLSLSPLPDLQLCFGCLAYVSPTARHVDLFFCFLNLFCLFFSSLFKRFEDHICQCEPRLSSRQPLFVSVNSLSPLSCHNRPEPSSFSHVCFPCLSTCFTIPHQGIGHVSVLIRQAWILTCCARRVNEPNCSFFFYYNIRMCLLFYPFISTRADLFQLCPACYIYVTGLDIPPSSKALFLLWFSVVVKVKWIQSSHLKRCLTAISSFFFVSPSLKCHTGVSFTSSVIH